MDSCDNNNKSCDDNTKSYDDIDESCDNNQTSPNSKHGMHESLNLSARRFRESLLFCEENRVELGGNWIVAKKKEKLQPNNKSCNENIKVATKTSKLQRNP